MRRDGPVPGPTACDRGPRGPWPTRRRCTPSTAFRSDRTVPANGLEQVAGICLADTYAGESARAAQQVLTVVNAGHDTPPRHPSCVIRAARSETQVMTCFECFNVPQLVERTQNRRRQITKMSFYDGYRTACHVGAILLDSVVGVTSFAGNIVSERSENTRL